MTEPSIAQSGALEKPEDAGEGKAGIVKRWMLELDLSSKQEEWWRDRAEEAVCRYRDESKAGKEAGYYTPDDLREGGNRFNILYSNVSTIIAALYSKTPKPDVRRRYRDEDPAGKEVAEVLERALSYSMDSVEDEYDFDLSMEQTVLESQLAGRGVDRVRYNPAFVQEQDKDGNAYERVVYESVGCEHVPWKSFRLGPGRTWYEVPWVAYEHLFTREDLVKNFKGLGKKVSLDYSPAQDAENAQEDTDVVDTFKRARVWEIWDKTERKVIWIAPGYKDAPLKVEGDPLGLRGFFDIPRPLYAVTTTESLVPIEPFRYYRKQARELDKITERIDHVIDACIARGIYDSTIEEFEKLMKAGDTIMIPTTSAANLMSKGGLENSVWMWPVEKIAAALVYLYQQRDQIKQTIYEITGIADIMRGATDARETLGSQKLKAQFGGMRIDKQRKEVERYARDLVRLKAELIAEKFAPETLTIMTGKQVTPDMVELMRRDGPRGFRIEVETDHTTSQDVADKQRALAELLAGISQFVQGIGPAVQAGYLSKAAAIKLIMTAVRHHQVGREVEDALEAEIEGQAQGGGQPQQGQNPEAAKQQAEQQKVAAEVQMKRERSLAEVEANKQVDIEKAKLSAQNAALEIQGKQALAKEKQDADIRMAEQKLVNAHDLAMYQAARQAEIKEQQAKAMASRPKPREAA